jgi:hypothetical protein
MPVASEIYDSLLRYHSRPHDFVIVTYPCPSSGIRRKPLSGRLPDCTVLRWHVWCTLVRCRIAEYADHRIQGDGNMIVVSRPIDDVIKCRVAGNSSRRSMFDVRIDSSPTLPRTLFLHGFCSYQVLSYTSRLGRGLYATRQIVRKKDTSRSAQPVSKELGIAGRTETCGCSGTDTVRRLFGRPFSLSIS